MSSREISSLESDANSASLTGWGRTNPSVARVVQVRSDDDIVTQIHRAGQRGILARGLGRSYGDAAQSGGASILDLTAMSSIELDPTKESVTAGAGASLDTIMRAVVPAGYFVPVTPGTRMVSVGGAISADVHGKNHHVDGTFGSHVTQLRVVDGTGSVIEMGQDDPRFWATTGGMGLTGVIAEATFDVIPIESSRILVDTVRAESLDDVMAQMIDRDGDYRYSVAWVDSVHPSGRGVITRGDHAPADALSARDREDALAFAPKAVASAPKVVPAGLVNPWTMRAFNEAWYRKAPRTRSAEVQSISTFFHPLDGVRDWNRVYGPGGFLQYQFAVPDEAGELVRETLAALRVVGALSALTVLKRFGPENRGMLSFPREGWTLAVDVPARVPGLAATLDALDERVKEAGGRLYLAKDSRMSAEMMAATYPRLDEWRSVRRAMDPQGIFTSDLARRLSL